MLKSSNLIKEIAPHYKPELVKCNPIAILKPELEWLLPTSEKFKKNIQTSIIPDDIFQYLSSLNFEKVFKFLIGFHAINFQYWEPKSPNGFTPYIHNEQSGFYASLYAFKDMFFQLVNENRLSLTKADIFQSFDDIPLLQERFQLLQVVWEPSILEHSYQLILSHIKKGVFSLLTAIELQKLLPHVFNDSFLRKNILFLWDIKEMYNYQNGGNIQDRLPVVSDHQVAKVFHMYNLLHYSKSIEQDINNEVIFFNESEQEMAIRSAAFFMSNQICERNKISPYQLYKSVWAMRTSKKHPFILTNTTDY